MLTVEINYDAPGGSVTAAIAKLFGEEPGQQVQEDLRRLKQILEAGEAASTTGQPSGKDRTADQRPASEEPEEKPADRILSHGR